MAARDWSWVLDCHRRRRPQLPDAVAQHFNSQYWQTEKEVKANDIRLTLSLPWSGVPVVHSVSAMKRGPCRPQCLCHEAGSLSSTVSLPWSGVPVIQHPAGQTEKEVKANDIRLTVSLPWSGVPVIQRGPCHTAGVPVVHSVSAMKRGPCRPQCLCHEAGSLSSTVSLPWSGVPVIHSVSAMKRGPCHPQCLCHEAGSLSSTVGRSTLTRRRHPSSDDHRGYTGHIQAGFSTPWEDTKPSQTSSRAYPCIRGTRPQPTRNIRG